jgi:hypothetical protein
MLHFEEYYLSGRTVKERRNNIISKISMRSKSMDWEYAIQLAFEWHCCEEKYLFLEYLGEWSVESAGCVPWIDRVERHLERVLADICGEPYTRN